jgi:hypothetical protein
VKWNAAVVCGARAHTGDLPQLPAIALSEARLPGAPEPKLAHGLRPGQRVSRLRLSQGRWDCHRAATGAA